MEKTYTLNLKTVNKYCLHDMHNQYYLDKDIDTIAHKFHTGAWHSDHERYIQEIHDWFPNFDNHIGNLFYIITANYEPWYGYLVENIFDSEIHKGLKNICSLQELLESGDIELGNVDLAVRRRSILEPCFVSSNGQFSKVFIEGILKAYKERFIDYYEFYWSDLTNRLRKEENISTLELNKIIERLTEKPAERIKTLKRDIEKEMIKTVLEYINEETELNPKKQIMNTQLGVIIYYLLLIFGIVTEQETERPRMVAHIRTKNRHGKITKC